MKADELFLGLDKDIRRVQIEIANYERATERARSRLAEMIEQRRTLEMLTRTYSLREIPPVPAGHARPVDDWSKLSRIDATERAILEIGRRVVSLSKLQEILSAHGWQAEPQRISMALAYLKRKRKNVESLGRGMWEYLGPIESDSDNRVLSESESTVQLLGTVYTLGEHGGQAGPGRPFYELQRVDPPTAANESEDDADS